MPCSMCLGVKLHSWLVFLAIGMRAVRRHQGDSSQEDFLTHHCLRLFCEDWSSVNNAVPVTSSHEANSSSSLQCRAKKQRNNFKFMSGEMFCLCLFPTGIDSRTLYKLSHFIVLLKVFEYDSCHAVILMSRDNMCTVETRVRELKFPHTQLFNWSRLTCPHHRIKIPMHHPPKKPPKQNKKTSPSDRNRTCYWSGPMVCCQLWYKLKLNQRNCH